MNCLSPGRSRSITPLLAILLFAVFPTAKAVESVESQLTPLTNGTVANATTVTNNFRTLGQAIDKVLAGNVIWVAKSGGQFTSIAEALAYVVSQPSGTAATAVNPYVIRVAPGAYQEPTLAVPAYTSIIGSGPTATRIYSQDSPGIEPLKGATEVRLADFELTLLGDNTGYGLNFIAANNENIVIERAKFIVTVPSGAGLYFKGTGSLILQNVEVAVTGTDAGSMAGVELRGGADLHAVNSEINAGGSSDAVLGVNIVGAGGSAELDTCSVTAGGSNLVAGIYLDASTATTGSSLPEAVIRNSVLRQTGGSGFNSGSGVVSGAYNPAVSGTSPSVYIAHTEMNTESAGDLYPTRHHAYKWGEGNVQELSNNCRILSN